MKRRFVDAIDDGGDTEATKQNRCFATRLECRMNKQLSENYLWDIHAIIERYIMDPLMKVELHEK